jgi:5'-deoxynucleotidase YfbR-like HD superfamily hydrolase
MARLTPVFMTTSSGADLSFDDPKPHQIKLKDIITSLSHQYRFAGHGKLNYTVAQHSVFVADLIATRPILWKDIKQSKKTLQDAIKYGLIHDFHETYTGDINSNVKQVFRNANDNILEKLEERLDRAMFKRFEMEYPPSDAVKKVVKRADKLALYVEGGVMLRNPTKLTKSWQNTVDKIREYGVLDEEPNIVLCPLQSDSAAKVLAMKLSQVFPDIK